MHALRSTLPALAAAFLCGCPATGPEAMAKMTPEQRAFATGVLAKVPAGATVEQVAKVIGGTQLGGVLGRQDWRRPGAPATEDVSGYFLDGKLYKLRYTSISPAWVWDLDAQGGVLVPRDR